MVTYVKVWKEGIREYVVECVEPGGGCSVDGVYNNANSAEKRAEKLAKMYSCDWGGNY